MVSNFRENEIDLLRGIVEEIGLEELLLQQGFDPVDLLIRLYEYGDVDLERLLSAYEVEEDED